MVSEWVITAAEGATRTAQLTEPGTKADAAIPPCSVITLSKGPEGGALLMGLSSLTLEDLRAYSDALSNWLNRQGQ